MNQSKKQFYINSFLTFDVNNNFSIKKRKLCRSNKEDRSLFCLDKDNKLRLYAQKIIESKIFVSVIMLSIFANCCVLAAYTMYSNNDSNAVNKKLELSEPYFITIFTIECILKIIVYGFILHPKSYIRDYWNVLDFFIIIMAFLTLILSEFVQNSIDVKALRAFRVLRPLRLISRLPSLRIVMNSIIVALKPLANIAMLVIFIIILFAIVGMNLFLGDFHTTCYNNVTYIPMPNPVPCSLYGYSTSYQCENLTSLPTGQAWVCMDLNNVSGKVRFIGPNYGITNFDNIAFATLTVFQILTRQGWTDIKYYGDNVYGNSWPWLYFMPLVFVGSYFVLNLIIGVLCGQFTKVKLKVERREAFMEEKQSNKEMEDFLHYKLWIEEAEKEEVKPRDDDSIKTTTDIKEVLIMIDQTSDETQLNKFQNFLKELSHFKNKFLPYKERSQHYLLTLIKRKIYFIIILTLVFINSAILATEFTNQPTWLSNFQNYSNLIFILLFTIEMILKLYAMGIRLYFKKILNIFDFIVITLSIIEIILTITNIISQWGISIIRSFRFLRIFKLTEYWDSMNSLVKSMIKSLKSILSLLLLMAIFLIIASLLGMQLFGGKYNFNSKTILRPNFNNIFDAIMSVFQLITIELWNQQMFNGIQALGGIYSAGSLASLYFVLVIIVGNYILLNAFFAIVLQILRSGDEKEVQVKKFKDTDSLTSDVDPSDEEIEVPVVDHLVVVNGCPLMPPNAQSDIVSLNPIKTKFRKYQNLEHRVRIVMKEKDIEKPKIEDKPFKVTYKELYAEEEEDAINMGMYPVLNVVHEPKTIITIKRKVNKLPAATSLFLFSSENKFRIFCHNVISHSLTKHIIFVVIICAVAMLAFYDPLNPNSLKHNVLYNIDKLFTAIFILELILNLISYGVILHKDAYFRNLFNWVDFFVVVIGIVDISLSNVELSALKSLRILRVINVLRKINAAVELKHVINSIILSIINIWKISLVWLLLHFIFSVIGVILFKGKFYSCTDSSKVTQETCQGIFISYSYDGLFTTTVQNRTWSNYALNYDNVLQAMLTLFVSSTYQGWPLLLYKTIDATSENNGPYFNNNQLAFIYYLIYFIVMKFFMINIFIGFVVISYETARESQFKSDALNKNQKQCIEFVLKCRPTLRYIPTVAYRYKIWKLVTSSKFNYTIFVIIILNTISMCAMYDNQPEIVTSVTTNLNYIFIIIFTVEAILKIIAFGFRNYFDDGMNIFDCIVVLGSYVDIAFINQSTSNGQANINIFRLFRALRLIKLLMKRKSIRKLLWTFLNSFRTLPWAFLLMVVLFFIYSIIGMQLFGRIGLANPGSAINHNNNFKTLLNSILVLFRCVTGENWQEIMISCNDPVQSRCIDSLEKCGTVVSYVYFPSFTMFCSYLVMNLFLAILIDKFDYLTKDISILSPHHLEEFIEKWSDYDIGAKGRIPPLDVISLLRTMDPPLGFGKLCSHDKCMRKLMHLNMPLEKDGTILFHATLFSLIRNNLSIKIPHANDPKPIDEYNEELRLVIKKLWKKTDPLLLEQIIPSNVKETVTVGKFYATFIIQNMFRIYKHKKKEKEVTKIIEDLAQQDEEDIINISGIVLHKDEVYVPPPGPTTLEIVQENYDQITDSLWDKLKNIFIIPDDDTVE